MLNKEILQETKIMKDNICNKKIPTNILYNFTQCASGIVFCPSVQVYTIKAFYSVSR